MPPSISAIPSLDGKSDGPVLRVSGQRGRRRKEVPNENVEKSGKKQFRPLERSDMFRPLDRGRSKTKSLVDVPFGTSVGERLVPAPLFSPRLRLKSTGVEREPPVRLLPHPRPPLPKTCSMSWRRQRRSGSR